MCTHIYNYDRIFPMLVSNITFFSRAQIINLWEVLCRRRVEKKPSNKYTNEKRRDEKKNKERTIAHKSGRSCIGHLVLCVDSRRPRFVVFYLRCCLLCFRFSFVGRVTNQREP